MEIAISLNLFSVIIKNENFTKKIRTLVNLIITLTRNIEQNFERGTFIAIKFHNNPCVADPETIEINLPYYEEVTPET